MKRLKKLAFITVLSFLLFDCSNEQKRSSERNVDSPTLTPAIDTQPIAAAADTQRVTHTVVTDRTNPQELISIIKNYQRKIVRDSWGIQLGEAYTNDDLAVFNQGSVFRILDELKKDKVFSDLIKTIKQLPPSQQTDLLNNAENTYRQRWSVLALDPATATRTQLLTGQTEAGSTAERSIAEAIVGYVKGKLNE